MLSQSGGTAAGVCAMSANMSSLTKAAAASHLFTLAGSVAEDLIRVLARQTTDLPRIMVAWVTIAATVLGTAVFLAIADIDLLQAAVTAFAFAAATFFPVLLLAIWWRRCTRIGAMLALGTGFTTMAVEVAFGGAFGSGQAGLTTVIAALIGALLAIVAGVVASLLTEAPSPAEEDYFEELRDPAGEALYDRAQRRPAPPSP